MYSPPGSPAYKSYIPTSEKAGIRFDLMPFSIGNSPIQLRLRETQEIPEITPAPAPEGDLNYSRSGYENLIDQTGKHIENKGWGKVVISRSQQYAVKNLDALQLFHALRRQYPNACVYLLQHASCGVWMGATPELLISGKRGLLQSMSLAGTRRKGEEHTFEPKEEEEQAIVTRYIRNVLQVQTGVANIRVSERDKLPAGDLIHFVNRISAEYGNTL
ncbi:MAG: chorismate-binding protein, partial [Owenweeksia sp.]